MFDLFTNVVALYRKHNTFWLMTVDDDGGTEWLFLSHDQLDHYHQGLSGQLSSITLDAYRYADDNLQDEEPDLSEYVKIDHLKVFV